MGRPRCGNHGRNCLRTQHHDWYKIFINFQLETLSIWLCSFFEGYMVEFESFEGFWNYFQLLGIIKNETLLHNIIQYLWPKWGIPSVCREMIRLDPENNVDTNSWSRHPLIDRRYQDGSGDIQHKINQTWILLQKSSSFMVPTLIF